MDLMYHCKVYPQKIHPLLHWHVNLRTKYHPAQYMSACPQTELRHNVTVAHTHTHIHIDYFRDVSSHTGRRVVVARVCESYIGNHRRYAICWRQCVHNTHTYTHRHTAQTERPTSPMPPSDNATTLLPTTAATAATATTTVRRV